MVATASDLPPLGPTRGRRLLGTIAVAAIVLTGAGCGLFGDDDADPPTGEKSSAGLTSSEAALCELGGLLVEEGMTLERLLVDDGPDVAGMLVYVGTFLAARSSDVRAMGPYAAGIDAIDRRHQLRMEQLEGRTDAEGVRLPDVEPTDPELASVRAADAFLAEGRCPPFDP